MHLAFKGEISGVMSKTVQYHIDINVLYNTDLRWNIILPDHHELKLIGRYDQIWRFFPFTI